MTEEIASLDMELDEIDWIDFEDSDFLDILEEIGRGGDPSQIRTQQMWTALLNENRAEQDTLNDLSNRSLVKRHSDLQAMVKQREQTSEFSEAYRLLKDQIKDLDDKLGIKQVVE